MMPFGKSIKDAAVPLDPLPTEKHPDRILEKASETSDDI